LSGSNLFVTNAGAGTIDEYTTSGAKVQTSLITGLDSPQGIAISGSDLFVTNFPLGTVGEYTTSGATANASLITGLSSPQGVAVSGSDVFVTNNFTGTIGEYTTSGATVNASLITGLHGPVGIVVFRIGSLCCKRFRWNDRRIHHFRGDGERVVDHGVEWPDRSCLGA
jgi:DNA-binding beta-propeller fold protein YncE